MLRIRIWTAAIACAAWMGWGTTASAAAPGVNLSWSRCATTTASADKAYLCDGAYAALMRIQGTFRPSLSLDAFAGIHAVVRWQFAESVPDYWRFDQGGCVAGYLTLANPSSSTPCTTPTIFDPAYSAGGMLAEFVPPDQMRLTVDWFTGATVPPHLTAGLLYPAFLVGYDVDFGVNEWCLGCEQPACIVLDKVEVWGFDATPHEVITTPDVRRWVTWQGGGIAGAVCPAAVPVRNSTWGAVKRLYR